MQLPPLRWRSVVLGSLLALLALIAFVGPARAQSNTAPADVGQPVALDGVELFRLHGALGPFTASERAARTQARLLEFAEDPFFSPELFGVTIVDDEGELRYADELVSVVTRLDAAADALPIQECVARRLTRAREAIESYRQRRLPDERWKMLGLSAAATLGFALLLVLVGRLHRRLLLRLTPTETQASPTNVERLRRDLQRRFLSTLRWIAVGVLTLVYLEVVFALIPLTRSWALALLGYALRPLEQLGLGLLANVGDLFFILVVVLLARWSIQLLRFLAVESQRGTIRIPGVEPDHSLRVFKLARLVVIATAIVTVFPYVPGSDSPAFRGLSLLFGAVFTFGSSGAAANFAGGLLLVFSRLFRTGDRIRVGEVEGDVVELDLLVTRLRTSKNEIVTVPNGSLLSGQVVNYSARAATEGLVLHTTVTIGYDTPWRQVHELLLSAARRTNGLLSEPAPFVHQTELGDFYVSYELNATTREPRRMKAIYSELHQNIQDEFNAAGVQIMSPHYEADPPAPKLAPLPR
ncbi:MAG: mechanosensitive ion channel family protein [Planctomycetaceae bacterium]|nr:mechanosensitive ion channel family protein [Planctomycetaceae bacterium]